uniref:Uncharacterized protein n=1 Tax=Pseudomonas fluorescens (strain SBW25) TaxID=216595 RepID=A0A0G4E5B7_PSEFS|nr:hypothetical protein PQBR57_0255 [Pseudomonas fluorescens SBW25]
MDRSKSKNQASGERSRIKSVHYDMSSHKHRQLPACEVGAQQ